MMAPSSGPQGAHDTSGLSLLASLALAGWLLLTVVGSFVPFDFTPLSLDDTAARWTVSLATLPATVSKIDVVSNVILFVPVGFLLTASLALRQRRTSATIIDVWLALVACGILAVVIEAAQVYFPSRDVTPTDIMAETMGGVIGSWMWMIAGRFICRALGTVSSGGRHGSFALLLLLGYGLLMTAAALLPFDITLEPSELAAKFRAGLIVLVPFSAMAGDTVLALTHALTVALAAAPLGVLIVWSTRRRDRPVALGLSIVFLAALEAAQVLIVSRRADTTDIILGAAGLLAGAALAAAVTPSRAARGFRAAGARAVVHVAVLLWFVAYALAEWAPFTFTADPQVVGPHWAALASIPLLNYFRASEWNAFINLVQKMMLIVPLGFLAAASLRIDEDATAGRVGTALGWTAVMLLAVEVGQVFLPDRAPDLTDVLIGTIGGGVGVLLLAMAPPAFLATATGARQEQYELL